MSAVRHLAERLREVAKEESGRASPPARYFIVTDDDPLTLKDTASNLTLDEDDEGFELMGWARFYHEQVGLDKGDFVLCVSVDPDAAGATWVAISTEGDVGQVVTMANMEDLGLDSGATLAESGKGYVAHGTVAATERPDGFASIEWLGSATPTYAEDGDTWGTRERIVGAWVDAAPGGPPGPPGTPVDYSLVMRVVSHGAVGGTARPTGVGAVYWIGAATPTNAISGDLWFG